MLSCNIISVMNETSWQERARKRMRDMGLTQGSLASKLGITQGALSHWLGGKRSATIEVIHQIAAALDMTLLELLGENDISRIEGDNIHSPTPATQMIPLIDWVKAGDLCESSDIYQPGDAEAWFPAPCACGDRSFYLTVAGDSMAPKYTDGMKILVDPDVEPSHGKDVVIRTHDGKSTFKRLQITPDGAFLQALNPDYPNRMIEVPADTKICGVVIAALMMV